MSNPGLTRAQLQEAIDAVNEADGNIAKAARDFGIPENTFRNRYNQARLENIRPGDIGETHFVFETKTKLPAKRVAKPRTGVRRLIVSAAQDKTEVHGGFLDNMEAYAKHCDAEILIGAFTYNKALFEDPSPDAVGSHFHPRVAPYLISRQHHFADAVAICAEMNTLPTAVRPLSGLQTYSGKMHGVFPHAKIALETVAQPKSFGSKFNYTTGAVTLPNYIQKKAGMKAQHHHVIGALLIEADAKGRVWARHLIANKAGDFQDLDIKVSGGKVTTGNGVKAITWGDIHHEKIDPIVADGSFFAKGSMLDALKPEFQFFHDLIDFRARNHHNIKDIHFMFERWCRNEDCVEADMRSAAQFLEATKRDWCRSIVVESNHDLALLKWLKKSDAYAMDPVNAIFFLRCQIAVFEAIANRVNRFSIFEHVCRSMADIEDIEFLIEDDSFMVDDVDHGCHGHLGANGGRGSPTTFAKAGPKMTGAHGHSPAILDGFHRVGVCQLEMGYNKGLSSWAVAHDVQYGNGKRTLITMNDGDWRA